MKTFVILEALLLVFVVSISTVSFIIRSLFIANYQQSYGTTSQQQNQSQFQVFLHRPDYYDRKYGSFSEELRLQALSESRNMFTFAYDNYIKYAFPYDELNPIYCRGRGPDINDP